MMPAIRQDNEPAFVLHTYPYRESSLIVEFFSRHHGRITALAKGARRQKSDMRGMLQTFQHLLATWSGKSELRTLHGVELQSGILLLPGKLLMYGFYFNELLLRLLPHEDPHEALFDCYAQTLQELPYTPNIATTIRRLELKLLQHLGYTIPLLQQANGEPIEAGSTYCYVHEHGAVPVKDNEQKGVMLAGKTLLDMAQDCYDDAVTVQQSKQLMRTLLMHYLGEKPLYTRQLLFDLQRL